MLYLFWKVLACWHPIHVKMGDPLMAVKQLAKEHSLNYSMAGRVNGRPLVRYQGPFRRVQIRMLFYHFTEKLSKGTVMFKIHNLNENGKHVTKWLKFVPKSSFHIHYKVFNQQIIAKLVDKDAEVFRIAIKLKITNERKTTFLFWNNFSNTYRLCISIIIHQPTFWKKLLVVVLWCLLTI